MGGTDTVEDAACACRYLLVHASGREFNIDNLHLADVCLHQRSLQHISAHSQDEDDDLAQLDNEDNNVSHSSVSHGSSAEGVSSTEADGSAASDDTPFADMDEGSGNGEEDGELEGLDEFDQEVESWLVRITFLWITTVMCWIL